MERKICDIVDKSHQNTSNLCNIMERFLTVTHRVTYLIKYMTNTCKHLPFTLVLLTKNFMMIIVVVQPIAHQFYFMIISTTSKFERQLKQITKKHPETCEIVKDTLNNISNRERTSDKPMRRCKGYPIFMARCPLKNTGKSSGARVIYFKDLFKVVAVCIYLKSEQNSFPENEIIRIFEQSI